MIIMYDSVELSTIPRTAAAVAGYVGGFWPTFKYLRPRWPHARLLSIAVQPDQDAGALDVEKGDAQPAEVPAWVRRQHRRGEARPILYAALSQMPVVLHELERAGVSRKSYRLWSAHWTGTPHFCDSSCDPEFHDRAGATQFTNRALGRNLDASAVMGDWWFPRDS